MNTLLAPLLLLLFTLHVLPITAHIELCRCAAHFERFYDVSHNYDSQTTTSESNLYPYNYNDHYIDKEGYVIVEGIRVLSDSSTACGHETDNDENDDADDEKLRGRYLAMGQDTERKNAGQQRRIMVSKSQRHRALMGMMMMGGSDKVSHIYCAIFLSF
jgi:hypothetical protein